MTKITTLSLCAVVLLAGCRIEDTKPQVQSNTRMRAVMEAERKRSEAQAKAEGSQTPPSGAPAAAGNAPPKAPGEAGGGTPKRPAGYLPPSEHGAYVEMTETPAGSPPPPPTSKAGTVGGAGANARGGGTGGAVPHGVAPTPRAGIGGGLPPPGGPGSLGSQGAAPAVSGTSAPLGMPAGNPAATATELEQNRQEFDRLMREAKSAAARDNQGGNGKLPAAPVYGGGGATAGSTGLGASPDLTGVRGKNPRENAPSAQPPSGHADETIVARQLREAAEREPDPVLKQKLLLEYRKYTSP
jgi:hypothetical protein